MKTTGLWAPRCAMHAYGDCNKRVQYHKKYIKRDGTYGFKWKTFCEYHRTTMKSAVDKLKMQHGCANRDGRYGHICTATIMSPVQIQLHHKDGNKQNNSISNHEFLCANCHALVTSDQKHHLNRQQNTNVLTADLYYEEG